MRTMAPVTAYETAANTAVIVVQVFAEEKPVPLDRSARLELASLANHRGVFLIVPSHERAVFRSVELGKYEISVTALGYLTAHQEVNALIPKTETIDIVLHRDPSAVTLNEASGVMPRKARKEASQALSLLKSGQLADAQKHLENAYQLAPSNADLNFLTGYLHFERHDYAQAATYLSTAATLNPHSAQVLTLLGRTNLQRENYAAARSALEQALLIEPEDWLVHDLLAEAYFRQKEYEKARDEAQIAIVKGKVHGRNDGSAARIILGQALLGLGRKDEGIRALETFLNESPQNPLVYQVRALVTRLKKSDPIPPADAGPMRTETKPSQVDSVEALPDPLLSMQTWRPPDVDAVKPNVVPGIACKGEEVLAEAGKRVQELTQDITRIAAEENLFHQTLDDAGVSTSSETRKYDYVAAVSAEPRSVFIQEYRSSKVAKVDDPDRISSTGFAILALLFHPQLQGDFDFDCEGQGEWRGQASWLIHFRQRHDLPNRMHSYDVGGRPFRADLKGRAWISADKFQILRIEADMVDPIREIQLLSEHQTVEYGPVPFAQKNVSLWLPKVAEIYIDLRKHHYYRRHSFDHYELFSVDSEQKDKVPPVTGSSSQE